VGRGGVLKAPEVEITHRISPEAMRKLIKPCPICNAIEPELAPGVFGNIQHIYELHGIVRPNEQRREE
jgi:hypothetical protein